MPLYELNIIADSNDAIPIHIVNTDNFQTAPLSKKERQWCKTQNFEAKPGQMIIIPDEDGSLSQVLLGIETDPKLAQSYEAIWSMGDLPLRLPAGTYRLESDLPTEYQKLLCLSWILGSYQFTNFKTKEPLKTQLTCPKAVSIDSLKTMASAIYKVRDLINRPANDLTPEKIWIEAEKLAKHHKAKAKSIKGKDLLAKNFPAIYEVGKAAEADPYFIELTWGDKSHPHLILVGKGVTFDSGGLDIKPSSNMRLMKKDMGGAAHVLGLAHLIMANKMPVNLTVLIPSVENAISGNAYRPSDIIPSRKGLSIEIGNTDAEGRVILADALSYADDMKPDLIIDFATLTGAARVALGTEVPVLFCNKDADAQALAEASFAVKDPLWRLPLWTGYNNELDTPFADITNSGNGGYGGAITAALFLERFISTESVPWIHFDLMAWNLRKKPGRPEGGEAMAIRAIYHFLEKRYQA
ncbi:MAG: leucyl aminopeptidase family protein [Alphaproteobacteria bacterium]|nr:leucyl aminopeptidase family protein [Alphaproteobacteria bacterium]MBP9877002.1 leucyl aminopeptidase family protein [Alphaproteobacteria bacterium]